MELLMQVIRGNCLHTSCIATEWNSGEISGIKAKNGAEVSIKWSDNKATEIKITPTVDGNITIGYEKDNILKLNCENIKFVDGKYTIENANAGETYIFTE